MEIIFKKLSPFLIQFAASKMFLAKKYNLLPVV